MATRVAIDPNVRVRGNQTYAGLEDADGPLVPAGHVIVYERESGLSGPAEVTEVDQERRLVYLAVDWGRFREPESDRPGGSVQLQELWEFLRRIRGALEKLLPHYRGLPPDHWLPGRRQAR